MKENGFMSKLQNVLMPIGNFLANERHFESISSGLMSIIPLTVIGAIFQIIANPPVTPQMIAEGGIMATLFGGWYSFAQANQALIMTPYNMTMGLISIVAAFSMAYQLAKKYKMPALSNGVISMLIFLMVAAPATAFTLADGTTTIMALTTTYLGGPGLFTAILVAMVSVEITKFCVDKKITIKMPDSVPSFLQDTFTSMIPLFFNVVIIFGVNILVVNMTGMAIPQAIMTLLAAPLSAVNSVGGVIFLLVFTTLLWTFGIHGSMVTYPLIMPLMITALTENATLVAMGQAPVFSPILLYGALGMVGGCGNTLGLAILCSRSKSEQLKAIGKVSVIPGIFGVNEPVAFGVPIVFNPMMSIPYIGSTVVIVLLSWAAYATGIITPTFIPIMSLMPIGVANFLGTMNINNFIFVMVMIPVSVLVYYPFFKIYEKQLIEKEQAALSKAE